MYRRIVATDNFTNGKVGKSYPGSDLNPQRKSIKKTRKKLDLIQSRKETEITVPIKTSYVRGVRVSYKEWKSNRLQVLIKI